MVRPPFMRLLLAQAQSGDQSAVTLDVVLLQVCKQVSSVADHLEKAAAGMVVLLVELQVLVQVVDPVRQQRDLHFGRTGVALAAGIGLHDLGLEFLIHGVFLLLGGGAPFFNRRFLR